MTPGEGISAGIESPGIDTTSTKVILRHYEPFETALEDLFHEQVDDLMYGS